MKTEIPKTMQAVVLTGHGGLDKLVFHDDWPTPVSYTHLTLPTNREV